MKLEPARDAILSRIPNIGPGRAYQLVRALRDTGAIVPIGRRLYANPERLDVLIKAGFPTDAKPRSHSKPAA